MREMVKVAEERIKACASFGEALRLCWEVSGRGKGDVAWDCGWKDGGRVLSRILRDADGDDQRYMPHQMLVPFMVACRNAVPLWWLMLQLEMKPEDAPHFDTGRDFVGQFFGEQQECRRLLSEILATVKSSDAGDANGEAHFCLVEREVLPAWLVSESTDVSRRFMVYMAEAGDPFRCWGANV